jgi:hypothetical protein
MAAVSSSDDSSALDETHQNQNDRGDEQQMNEPAHRHGADEAERPEHEKDESNGPKHVGLLPKANSTAMPVSQRLISGIPQPLDPATLRNPDWTRPR